MKKVLPAILILLAAASVLSAGRKPATAPAAGTFEVKGGQFLLNGKPLQIISGEIHPFRVPVPYWKDRLLKARAMGLNTVCTYIFWNTLEETPGKFDFSEGRDIARYVRLAQETGLNVILRPGPYACAEWDFGGFPAWLLKDPNIRVRCMDPKYLEAAERYLLRLGRELAPLQIDRGGPIIMVQVENEYGSYGSDKAYLRWLRDTLRRAGFTVPLYTSDGPGRSMLEPGTLPDLTPVVNFGEGAQKAFEALKEFRTGIPQMCGEYWVGWFTQWGNEQWGDADEVAQKKELEWMLASGKSVNLYMFHGGTNWAFWAGANASGPNYWPDITSYDYGSPLDEAGNPTKEYFWMRDLFAKYQADKKPLPPLPKPLPTIDIPAITLDQAASVWDNLPEPKASVMPRSMEYYDQNLGYILYRTKIIGNRNGPLSLKDIKDYVQVYLDGRFLGKMDRRLKDNGVNIPRTEHLDGAVPDGGVGKARKDEGRELGPAPTLDLFIEALGRVNFGPDLLDRKGIESYAAINSAVLMDWEVFNLPMDAAYMAGLKFPEKKSMKAPAFFKGEFDLKVTGDTFLDLSRWKKGVVWVNGRNLGRYWEAGPQRDLFVPGCWLNKGKNEVIVFDLERTTPAPLFGARARVK
jgi:beta-galactosidase